MNKINETAEMNEEKFCAIGKMDTVKLTGYVFYHFFKFSNANNTHKYTSNE